MALYDMYILHCIYYVQWSICIYLYSVSCFSAVLEFANYSILICAEILCVQYLCSWTVVQVTLRSMFVYLDSCSGYSALNVCVAGQLFRLLCAQCLCGWTVVQVTLRSMFVWLDSCSGYSALNVCVAGLLFKLLCTQFLYSWTVVQVTLRSMLV